jgi:hypothetical protein
VSAYSEFRYYSPIYDCECARLSMFDSHGGEFFTILAVEDGRKWRERRNEALDVIETAIREGLQPGEVRSMAVYQLLTQSSSLVSSTPQTPFVQPYQAANVASRDAVIQVAVSGGGPNGSATVQVYGSNDGSSAVPIGDPVTAGVGAPASVTSVIPWQFFAAAITSLSAGSTASVLLSV